CTLVFACHWHRLFYASRIRSCVLLSFFFSSRRRHTRLVSDWSSDVCSSDLIQDPIHEYTLAEWHRVLDTNLTPAFLCSHAAYPRSEERRVGKEWRSRWSPEH